MPNKTTPDDDWLSEALDTITVDLRFRVGKLQETILDTTGAHTAINAKITELLLEEIKSCGVPGYFYWNKDGKTMTVTERIAALKLQASQPINVDKEHPMTDTNQDS